MTPAQEEWLTQKFRAEEKINALQKNVLLLEEKYDRILNERKRTPHWSAVDARIIIQEIEKSKHYAQSKKCTEPQKHLIQYCKAYQDTKADREWWSRLTLVSVQINEAKIRLIEAQIQAGEFGENTNAAKQKLMKLTGTT